MVLKRFNGLFTEPLVPVALGACLAAVVLFTWNGPARAAGSWPEGLKEAVYYYFQTLQVNEYRTRDSTLEEPLGIRPMVSFDRASHKCHEVPGQIYRIYKVPTHFDQDEGSCLIRSRFRLFYRQAEDVARIFAQPWEQGSDGVILVRFEKVAGKWEAVEKREILE